MFSFDVNPFFGDADASVYGVSASLNALIPSLQRLSKRVLWHDRSRLGLESFIRVISLDIWLASL